MGSNNKCGECKSKLKEIGCIKKETLRKLNILFFLLAAITYPIMKLNLKNRRNEMKKLYKVIMLVVLSVILMGCNPKQEETVCYTHYNGIDSMSVSCFIVVGK